MSTPQRLLVIYPCKFLGNLLLALPHLRALLQDNPDSLIVLDAGFQPLMELFLPEESRVRYFPRQALRAARLGSRLSLGWRFIRDLRRFKADVALELEGESASTTLMALSRARRKVGPFFTRRRWVFDELVSFPHLSEHRWYGMQAMCAPWHRQTLTPGYVSPVIKPAQRQALYQRLANWGLGPGLSLAALHVGASQDYKCWDPARFAELVEALRQRGWTPVLIGAGVRDRRQASQVNARLATPLTDLTDQLSLAELAVLFSECGVFIGNDSGPMHLAAACGIPVFAVFGPTVERIWAPVAPRAVVVRGTVACAEGCRTISCVQAYACLTSLLPTQVLTAMDKAAVVPRITSA